MTPTKLNRTISTSSTRKRRAERDLERHEQEMRRKPAVRTAPYVAVDNRPTTAMVDRLWPGAFRIAQRCQSLDLVPGARKAAEAEMRAAIKRGSEAAGIAIKWNTIDKITATLLHLAQHDMLRVV